MTIDEIGKALLTMLGTLIVAAITARLTVSLALDRFKSEKLYDRSLNIYADIIEALSEMKFVNEIWLERQVEQAADNPKYEAEMTERYKAARRKLDSAAAHARLLLPQDVTVLIRTMDGNFESNRQAYMADAITFEDAHESDIEIATETVNAILVIAKNAIAVHDK